MKCMMMALVLGLTVGTAWATPKVSKRVEPQYPAEAMRAGTTGFVELEYTVTGEGKVGKVSVLNAKPARAFEASAVRAIKQWEFVPSGAEQRGKIRLDFTL